MHNGAKTNTTFWLKSKLFAKSIIYFILNIREFGWRMSWLNARSIFKHDRGYSEFYIERAQRYVLRMLNPIIEKYKNQDIITRNISKRFVWLCWWQGYDCMPILVKTCYDRIKKVYSNSGFDVVLITKDNYKQFIDLPDYILEKFERKIIGMSHLADILRWGLISLYGGMWIDCSLYITYSNLDKLMPLFESPFYTQKYSSQLECPNEPCRGLWCNGYFYGNPTKTSLFNFVYDSLLFYWKFHNKAFHYVFLDYIIMSGYLMFQDYKKIIDEVVPNNKNMWLLFNKMNDIFNQQEWNAFCEKNDFYKIKYDCDLVLSRDGKPTYCNFLINQK